ncbi:MAG: MATE family efflux transporter [Thermofilum sp.]
MSKALRGELELERYRDRVVNGPVLRTLLWLGVPPMITQLVHVLYSVADSLWLSIYREAAIAVPRQTFPVLMLFGAAINALSAAGTALISQSVGSRDYEEFKREASYFFSASVLVGAALSFSFFALRPLIFTQVVATPPEILEEVLLYSAIMALDSLLMSLVMPLTTVLNSLGETRLPSIINVLAVLINIALDPFLILGLGPFPRLGVAGAAATDVLGKVFTLGGYFALLKRRFSWIKITFTPRLPAYWVRLAFRIASPVFLMMSTNSLAFIFQQRMVNAFGVAVATAYAIGFVILDIADGALWGLLGSISTMVGQALGAGRRDRAREAAVKASLFIATAVAAGALFVYVLRRQLVAVFASDPAVEAESVNFLETIVVGLPFFAMFMAGNSVGRGSGHTTVPTIIGVFRLWVLRVAGGYVLAFLLGLGSMGLWLAIMVSNIAGGLLMFYWVAKGDWAVPVLRGPATGGASGR